MVIVSVCCCCVIIVLVNVVMLVHPSVGLERLVQLLIVVEVKCGAMTLVILNTFTRASLVVVGHWVNVLQVSESVSYVMGQMRSKGVVICP